MNFKKPLVSIIVPVYNAEKYIRECLDSIMAQTYTNLECLIIQDGSTDNSMEICREYVRVDARIRLFEQENRGLSAARNRGLDNMRGEYLTFVDADDCLSKNFLEITMRMMMENAADIVVVDDKKFKNVKGKEPELKEYQSYSFTGRQILQMTGERFQHFFVPAWAKLYRRDIFCDMRFDEGKIHEDAFIFHRIYGKAKKICFVDEKLYYYRLSEESLTRINGIYYDHPDIIEALENRWRYYLEHNMTKNARDTAEDILQRLMRGYYAPGWDKKIIRKQIQRYRSIYKKQCGLKLRIELTLFKFSPCFWRIYKFFLRVLRKIILMVKRNDIWSHIR